MPSRILPTEELEQRGVMYFLPPGGQDNDVQATTWVVIAEFEPREIRPILAQLADAGIGGYAARPTGLRPGCGASHRLYVDGMQYNQAMDVVMSFLRGKESRDLGDYVPVQRAPRKSRPLEEIQGRSSVVRIAFKTVKVLTFLAFLALLIAIAYQHFANQYGFNEHQRDRPGIHQPSVRPPLP